MCTRETNAFMHSPDGGSAALVLFMTASPAHLSSHQSLSHSLSSHQSFSHSLSSHQSLSHSLSLLRSHFAPCCRVQVCRQAKHSRSIWNTRFTNYMLALQLRSKTSIDSFAMNGVTMLIDRLKQITENETKNRH